MKILVTGGSGFIGSNFIKFLLNETNHKVINLDNLTYAGLGKNIEHMGLDNHPNYKFVFENICYEKYMGMVFSKERPDYVFNFAAESHVDRSLKEEYLGNFIQTNIMGTLNLLKAAKKYGIEKFIHISTDEVYGSIEKGSFKETDPLNPKNPYSISKAAADWYAQFYAREKKLPVIITRSANNYGPYQFPEKLLSLFITNLIDGKKVPLMWSDENPGLNVRDWLYVEDNVRAIWHLSQKGKIGELYNVAGNNEITNIELTKKLLDYFGFDITMIDKIPHRQTHDFRYSIDDKKLRRLGFKHQYTLEKGLPKTIQFYQGNQEWVRPLKRLK